MKVYLSSDHRGNEIENDLANHIKGLGYEVIQTKLEHFATDSYPTFAFELANNVVSHPDSLGILVCGTGIGMSIAANKVKGIRAARCCSKDDAFYSKRHNNANVLCIGVEEIDRMYGIIDSFLQTPACDEEKHLNRVNMIISYEESAYNEL